MNFSETVKKYRQEKDMSLVEFAHQLDVTHPTIINWESGQTVASKYHLLALALRNSDWRRSFALDAIQAIDPAYFETAEMQKVKAA